MELKTSLTWKLCRYVISAENLKLGKQRRNSGIHANSVSNLKPIHCAYKLCLVLEKKKGRREHKEEEIKSDYLLPNSNTSLFVLRRVSKLNFQVKSCDCKQSRMLQDSWVIIHVLGKKASQNGLLGTVSQIPATQHPENHIWNFLVFFSSVKQLQRYIFSFFELCGVCLIASPQSPEDLIGSF